MRKMLVLIALALSILPLSCPAFAQAPASVFITTEHYAESALTLLANQVISPEGILINDDHVKIVLSEDMMAKLVVPKWIVTPSATEQYEFYTVHGIDRCGCPDGDSKGNGYNDFRVAWKLYVPESGLINLQYAQACLGGRDSVDVFVSASLDGPWVKILAIKTPIYCSYAGPYTINLFAAGLVKGTDYWLELVSRYYSVDVFRLKIEAQEPISTQSTSWGKIKEIYR